MSDQPEQPQAPPPAATPPPEPPEVLPPQTAPQTAPQAAPPPEDDLLPEVAPPPEVTDAPEGPAVMPPAPVEPPDFAAAPPSTAPMPGWLPSAPQAAPHSAPHAAPQPFGKDRCPRCGGANLGQGALITYGVRFRPAYFKPSRLSFFRLHNALRPFRRLVEVRAQVCRDCGLVLFEVDTDALAKVEKRSGADRRDDAH